MSLRLEGTISGWGRSAGAVIPARGSGRYSPGPNIVLPSWLQGSDPHCTLNVCWGQPGALATVSIFVPVMWHPRTRASEILRTLFILRIPVVSPRARLRQGHIQLQRVDEQPDPASIV